MGHIYQRGNIFWIKYYRNGKAYHESSKSDKEKPAKDLLKEREGEIAKGELPGVRFDKIRFEEIADDFLNDYRINQRKSVRKAEQYVEYLKKSFEGFRVMNINTARIKDHINRRIEKGLANATINRELSALKRMFSLASECTPKKVRDIPHIPMLKESNVRKGFFEYDQYMAIKNALPDYLKPIVTLAYHLGWRKGECLGLTWDKVDMRQRTVRLDPGETKNDEARNAYMNDELFREMQGVFAKRRLGCPYVFHHAGQPIRTFEKAWNAACRKAKLPGKLFHDFRRTAARNMVRSGIAERVAMTITGHKTRSIFDRYNIVSDQDLKEAARKQQIFIESQNGYNLVTIEGPEKSNVLNLQG
jgi:integrase